MYPANESVAEAPAQLTMQVSDSGPGLEPDRLDTAIGRRFTTKEPGVFGRGLGLGLMLQAFRRRGGA